MDVKLLLESQTWLEWIWERGCLGANLSFEMD
jgi:hypothetical protein